MKLISLIIDIVLGLGIMLVFNDSDTFTPNFIGLSCFGLLIFKHRHDVKTEQQ